jgi:hypothetical protein
MVVNQVRRYSDGSYEYGVGNADLTNGQDDWGALDGADDLIDTGARVDVSLWDMPGPFDYRGIVKVSASHDDQDLRRQTGVIEGWYAADEDESEMIAVWFADLGRFDVVETKYLMATEGKAPRPTPGEQTTSTMVGIDGSPRNGRVCGC